MVQNSKGTKEYPVQSKSHSLSTEIPSCKQLPLPVSGCPSGGILYTCVRTLVCARAFPDDGSMPFHCCSSVFYLTVYIGSHYICQTT